MSSICARRPRRRGMRTASWRAGRTAWWGCRTAKSSPSGSRVRRCGGFWSDDPVRSVRHLVGPRHTFSDRAELRVLRIRSDARANLAVGGEVDPAPTVVREPPYHGYSTVQDRQDQGESWVFLVILLVTAQHPQLCGGALDTIDHDQIQYRINDDAAAIGPQIGLPIILEPAAIPGLT